MTSNGTSAVAQTSGPARSGRVDWVDYAKGICIIMVVMMHSVLGVELAAGQTGFMHLFVAFAKPFRMPDFFLISGLFLPLVIDRDWRTYLDRKVVHFAYFYVLWVTIQFGFKAPGFAAEIELGPCRISLSGILHRAIRHAVVHLRVADLLRGHQGDATPAAAADLGPSRRCWRWPISLPAGPRSTNSARASCISIPAICLPMRYSHCPVVRGRNQVWHSPRSRSGQSSTRASCRLGLSEWPVISLLLGLAGACAVVVIATLLARTQWIDFIRFCGEHSIVIYLAFFLPMAATRTLLLRTGIIHDVGAMSLTVTLAALFGALAIWQIALRCGANFLFERPKAFWIAPKKTGATLQAAE